MVERVTGEENSGGEDSRRGLPWGGQRRLPDGTLWIGDDSSGYPEGRKGEENVSGQSADPVEPERSYWEMYGGGKPNPAI